MTLIRGASESWCSVSSVPREVPHHVVGAAEAARGAASSGALHGASTGGGSTCMRVRTAPCAAGSTSSEPRAASRTVRIADARNAFTAVSKYSPRAVTAAPGTGHVCMATTEQVIWHRVLDAD